MDQFEDHICPACRRFFPTIKGVHSHLTSSRKCAWYKRERYKQVSTHFTATQDDSLGNTDFLDDTDFYPDQELSNPEDMDDEMDPEDVIEEMEELFQFIPLPEPLPEDGQPQQSSTSQRSGSQRWTSIHLEKEEDSQYVETPYPDAGYVTGVDEDLHSKWKRYFGHQNMDEEGDVTMQDGIEPPGSFAPFASELDWRVASWAIKDGIGHNSFDRLLAIPGVSSFILSH